MQVDRDRGARGPREVDAGARADRDGARPVGRGAAPRADHRPGLRLDDAARRGAGGVRRRARSRAVRAEHAGRRRPGARGAVRGGGRRGLDAAVGRAPGRRRRPRHPARPARRHPGRPGRSRRRRCAQALDHISPHQPGRGAGRGGQRGHRRRACRSCAMRWNGWWRRCPSPIPPAPVRLWVDRSFSIRGSGTVVTGTLPAGTVRTGRRAAAHPVAAARQDPGPGVH